MLTNSLTSNTDNEPHTLRSILPSNGIPICRPSHLSSMSLSSNPLQISQSPTVGFLTEEHGSHIKMSGMNTDSQEENSTGELLASEASTLSYTINQTGPELSTFTETKSIEEMHVSNRKSDEQSKEQEHKQSHTQDLNVSPCTPANPSTELSHETSFNPSSHIQNNPFSNIAFSPVEFSSPSQIILPPDLLSSLKFFSFVILHVPEDQDEAERICAVLNRLDIGEGTTFCEGFETAGVSPLKCLEEAVDNSAYIVLLLTTGFLSIWGEFQTNTVLMNSIDDKNKLGTVIPLIPKIKAPIGRIPIGLKSLIPLDEKSRHFERQVRNTFKKDVIKRQQERWTRQQVSSFLRKKLEDAEDVSSALRLQQYLVMDMSALLSSLPQQVFTGNGSVIQINNASNVQIGNQNLMNVQQTTNMEMPSVCYQDCNKFLG